MKTFMAKAESVQRDWFVIDADGVVLGRLAAQVAAVLRGKHKPTFTPHVDTGDHVIIINADKIRLTGNKLDDKLYRTHSGFAGGLKEIPYRTLLAKKADFAIREAVRGMLPHNSLGRAMLKKLKVYKGAEHKHEAQQPKEMKIKG